MSRPPDTGQDAVYLDYAATAPLRPEVREAMERARSKGGDRNPASTHAFGQRAHRHLEDARASLAEVIGAPRRDIRFTAGGTASDNLAVLGFARAHADDRPRILVSAVEHKAVIGAAERAAAEGARVRRIPVDAGGRVELDRLEDALASGDGAPTLVSVMWANNEVGTVQPVARAAELAREHGAVFHSDAVQALGKTPVSVEEVPVDLLTVTAHKLGGPVGIGLLYVREGVPLEPLTYGGSQERSLWPGTQNAVGAVGFAEAARLIVEEMPELVPEWRSMRDGLAERLQAEVPGLRIHAEGAENRLPNLLSVGIPGCDQADLLLSLDLEGVAASSGSACSSGSVSPSHVLEAMGLPGPEEYAALRFSFGPETAGREVERAAEATAGVVSRLRESSPARA